MQVSVGRRLALSSDVGTFAQLYILLSDCAVGKRSPIVVHRRYS